MPAPLLHLATPSEWRAHLDAGKIAPPSLSDAGFVHLSTPEQVALPAGRIFAGRRDLVLLALDPARIGVDVRFEPGVPTDPASMRFPHAYGPVPTSAVLAVLPYRPRPDGAFDAPAVPALDDAGRVAALVPSLRRRAATSEAGVTGGVAVRTEPAGTCDQHHQLLVDGTTTVDRLVADAERTLGHSHRRARLTGPDAAGLAAGVRERGWQVEHLIGMAAPAGGAGDSRVEHVDLAALAPMWEEMVRHELPAAPNPDLVQAAHRYGVEQACTDLQYLAVHESGAVVASCVLAVDGATAWLESMITLPVHRRRGYAGALLAEALRLAGSRGCDLVGLEVLAEEADIRGWYARCGFAEVTQAWAVAAA